jgi:hypothetical protein
MPEASPVPPAADAERPEIRLRARDSLVQALDLFKGTGRMTLPVYEGKRFLGSLEKRQLLRAITEVLGETGEAV